MSGSGHTTTHYHTTTTHHVTTTHYVITTHHVVTTHHVITTHRVTTTHHVITTHHVVTTHRTVVRSAGFFHGVTSYHSARYGGVTLNIRFARNPGYYPGARWVYYGGRRWYNGYWYNYWRNQPWAWWGGHYGFWLDVAGINIFVYEYAPGECMYWNGYAWVGWYDPPYAPYGCPY